MCVCVLCVFAVCTLVPLVGRGLHQLLRARGRVRPGDGRLEKTVPLARYGGNFGAQRVEEVVDLHSSNHLQTLLRLPLAPAPP